MGISVKALRVGIREIDQERRTGVSAPYKTIFGWNRGPATRVAMAIRSRWPVKTLIWRARERSGRLMVRPLRMRAAVASSAGEGGRCGRELWGGVDKGFAAPT